MSSDTQPTAEIVPPGEPAQRRRSRHRGLLAGVALIVTLAVGVAIGGLVTHTSHAPLAGTEALLNPVQIAAMKDWSVVAIKGQVAEIFGNKFILQDGSGRALVETGPQGEDGALVAKDEAVTVAGRFEHGFVHAEIVVKADGRTVALGPPGPGLLGWLHHLHVEATSPAAIPPPTG